MAEMLRGGAAVEVTCLNEAMVAAAAGACCVVVSGDAPRSKEISRMADPFPIEEIKKKIKIPVMAKIRVGHSVEAQILESIGVDFIDENEITGIADADHFIHKHKFGSAFVCGARDLGEALRRITEGAAMIRTQGDSVGPGDIAGTVRSVRKLMSEIRILNSMDDDEVFAFAERIGAPYDAVAKTKREGKLPVVHFAAGGVVSPADAALMMKLGCDGVFVGQEVFDFPDVAYELIQAIVEAVRRYRVPNEDEDEDGDGDRDGDGDEDELDSIPCEFS